MGHGKRRSAVPGVLDLTAIGCRYMTGVTNLIVAGSS